VKNINLYPVLLHTLTAENQAFKDFIHILERESTILQGTYTHEEIHQIAQQKTAWHQQYSQLQNKRRKVLQALELQDSVDALQELANNDPEFKTQLEALLEHAAQAQALNTTNGKLINEYLGHHQQALNALQSLDPKQAAHTYDASGKRSKGSAGLHTQVRA